MRANKELAAILVLLLIFIGAGLLLGGRQGDQYRRAGDAGAQDPSVYNDRDFGSKAFFEMVKDLGYAPEVSQRNWRDLSATKAKVLVTIEPNAQNLKTLTGGAAKDLSLLTPQDATTLKRWISSGHTAILMTSRLAFSTKGAKNPLTFADAMNIEVGSTSRPSGAKDIGPLIPAGLTDSTTSIHMISGMRIRQRQEDAVDLYGDSLGAGVAAIPIGKGWLVVVSDGAFASNSNLNRSDNAVFLSNVLSQFAKSGDQVLFDEYHHQTGDYSGGPSLWVALGRPAQLALGQALLVFLVLVWAVGMRFGTPVPLLRGTRRNSAEYVQSLAALYQRAGASVTSLETIYRQFLRDLTSKLALASDASLEEVAALAARRGNIDVNELRRVLAGCENAIETDRISEAELLDLVRRMDRIRKDTGIG